LNDHGVDFTRIQLESIERNRQAMQHTVELRNLPVYQRRVPGGGVQGRGEPTDAHKGRLSEIFSLAHTEMRGWARSRPTQARGPLEGCTKHI
jgi:hypothetical protein